MSNLKTKCVCPTQPKLAVNIQCIELLDITFCIGNYCSYKLDYKI